MHCLVPGELLAGSVEMVFCFGIAYPRTYVGNIPEDWTLGRLSRLFPWGCRVLDRLYALANPGLADSRWCSCVVS